MTNASYDRATGIITLISSGVQTAEKIRERTRVVEEMINMAKRQRGYALILTIAHDLPVQTTEIAEASFRQAKDNDRLDHPNDKFAIVTSSTLARMQMMRVIGSDKRRAFATEAEARVWLLGSENGAKSQAS